MFALLMLARDSEVALETEDFDVREVVEHEMDKVRPVLEEKGVALLLEIQAEPTLHAPPRAFQVMLCNLLSNAARFTDAGRHIAGRNEACPARRHQLPPGQRPRLLKFGSGFRTLPLLCKSLPSQEGFCFCLSM